LTEIIRLLDWLRAEALPSWADIGFDHGAGRFHERLDFRGRPVDVPHRAMVQGRQIYVYAHAARLGWFPDGGVLADRAMRGLVRDYAETSGGLTSFGYSLDPHTGQSTSAARDSYTHAFVLFALAHLYALSGDKVLLDTAERTTRYIEHSMIDPRHGGVFDDAAQPGAAKRQNPQMHLLEAYLALHEAAPDRGYAERADAIVELFYAKLCHPEHGVLVEHFAHDWAPHSSAEKKDRFEPGHHYEWIWLLRQHERTTEGVDHGLWRERLYDSARRHGLTGEALIHDELSADKTQVKAAHRLWPHTEAIKAAAVRHADGDPSARSFADQMADSLLREFLGKPFAGGWIDHISADLRPLVDYVPASSLYHLTLAAAEAQAHWGTQTGHAGRVPEQQGS
jgi:mannose-6-phosphate isomerase